MADDEGTSSRPMPLDGIDRRNPEAAVTRADLSTMAANVQRQLSRGDLRMSTIESQLKLNTSMTADTNAILADVKFGLKVIAFLGTSVLWLGRIAAAVAAIYGLYYLVVHGPAPKP